MTNHAACEDALSLVQKQRDQAMARADKAEMERDHFRKVAATFRDKFNASESRPLTPDAITDEMVERARRAYRGTVWGDDAFRKVLEAALTEPPQRPEGAEEIEALIREAEKVGQGADDESLANYLAARLADPTRKEA